MIHFSYELLVFKTEIARYLKKDEQKQIICTVAKKTASNKIINNHKSKWKVMLITNVNKHACIISLENITGPFA